ncbi:hypothetical protein ACH5RR_031664 [Cinchona calisaya]|uniref:Uncharacterized protein n=1 Tax=Cinchona calisaya TaxID=153742 RepID=A0ABD2YKB7_9GENT
MNTTNTTCRLLLLHPYHSPSPPPLVILHHHHHLHREQPPQENCPPPLQLTTTTTTTISTCNHHHLLLLQTLHICRSRRWDSNAESFRKQNFNYYDFDDADDDDTNENDDSLEQWSEVLEDYIDSIWIFKVFRSYGWLFPFILISILLATGLKAFLMALALPIGQSTFSFAIQRMWGGKENRPKRKTKTKYRSRARFSRTAKGMKERRVGTQGKKKAKMGYQSWVPGLDDSNDPVAKNGPTFGGWDELVSGREFDVGSSSSSGQWVDSSQKSPSEKSRSSMRTRETDAPLLLRLLIAVFPFLGSWTKMF